jgi:hypothetical protein
MRTTFIALLLAASAAAIVKPATALEPVAFSQCVAWNNGATYAVPGAGNRDRCFQLARMCTGNPSVQVTWYGSAVLVQTPYTQCQAR